MGIPGSANLMLLGGGAQAYQIDQSLRTGSDNQNLQRTLSASGNRRTWTWSGWIKRSEISAEQHFLESWNGSGDVILYARFNTNDTIRVKEGTPSTNFELNTNAVFRDPSAWYHIVIAFDTTQATASDRAKIYVNGELQSLSTATYPSQNHETFVNRSGYRFGLMGALWSTFYTRSFNGYMAESHLIDGTALDPTSFGETNDDGVWVPVQYTGSHGTEGCYIKFDPSATNGIGHDHSGNGNNLTNNNFTTSGTGTDVMSDTPTTNWATLNPLSPSQSQAALSNGNIDCTWSGVSGHSRRSTIAMGSGKWYAEITRGTSTLSVGLVDADIKLLSWPGNSTYGSTGSYAYRTDNGNKYNNGNASSYGNTIATGDVIGIAYDGDNGALYFSKNGTWQNSGDPTSGASATGAAFTGLGNQTWTIACGNAGGSTGGTATNFNFGQRAFEYTPPTGFEALNTSNLPAPDIADGSDYFDTVLYQAATSNGTYTHGDLDFRPDFTWIKNRDNVERHFLIDVVRGNTSVTDKFLVSNSTAAEGVNGTAGTTFSVTDTGYQFAETSIGTGELYFNNRTYVGWNWKAGGSGSSNTDGSITSTVSANPTAGFSIVTWTGTGNDDSYGHGLGVKPAMIIHKRRDSTSDWHVWHQGLPTTSPTNDVIYLNLDNGQNSGNNNLFRQDPTGTLIYTGTAGSHNASGGTYVDYVFAEVESYSRIGSYVGNGSADGPFVYCGFRPAYVWLKGSTFASNWNIYDSTRDQYNITDDLLRLNSAAAEVSDYGATAGIDLLSNGFKIRTSSGDWNSSGQTFVFCAFAENPFGGSGVSPATAR